MGVPIKSNELGLIILIKITKIHLFSGILMKRWVVLAGEWGVYEDGVVLAR